MSFGVERGSPESDVENTHDVRAPRRAHNVHDLNTNTPRLLPLFSLVLGELGSRRVGRALLKTLGLRRLAQRWLQATVVEQQRDRPDDVTVLIGIRNRIDHRLDLALRSIREQRYSKGAVNAVVIDYGSEPTAADHAAEICRQHQAVYIHVATTDVWSRSRCLNVGIRRTTTKFLLTSDVDILFSPNYIAEAVEALTVSPLSLICSRMLDLPEHTADLLRGVGERGEPLTFTDWKAMSSPRLNWRYHPSIAMTYTTFHHIIRGYDEFYELYGSEDLDLFSRLINLGLERRVLTSDTAYYLHQWHAKYESIPVVGRKEAVWRNHQRRTHVRAIVRNDDAWGLR